MTKIGGVIMKHKSIISLMLILITFVTGCSGQKNKTKDELKKSYESMLQKNTNISSERLNIAEEYPMDIGELHGFLWVLKNNIEIIGAEDNGRVTKLLIVASNPTQETEYEIGQVFGVFLKCIDSKLTIEDYKNIIQGLEINEIANKTLPFQKTYDYKNWKYGIAIANNVSSISFIIEKQ